MKQKAKKYLQELQTLKDLCLRKRQQLENALQMVTGLQKGTDVGRLLSGLGENRKVLEPAREASLTPDDKPRKGGSHRLSLTLYKEGMPVEEIAAKRNLSVSTIEGHLASFILTGDMAIKELVPEHKIAPIAEAIREMGGSVDSHPHEAGK